MRFLGLSSKVSSIVSGTTTTALSCQSKLPPATLESHSTRSRFHRRATTVAPNQILAPVTTPPAFRDYLQLASAGNILLLLLFTTSSCVPCRTISPLLQTLITSRTEQPADRFSALAFAEVELDSPDRSSGAVADLGVECGISSIPTLVGFGGRRAERVTDRVVDTNLMGSRERVEAWLDQWMEKGDPFGTGSSGPSDAGSLLRRLFGSG